MADTNDPTSPASSSPDSEAASSSQPPAPTPFNADPIITTGMPSYSSGPWLYSNTEAPPTSTPVSSPAMTASTPTPSYAQPDVPPITPPRTPVSNESAFSKKAATKNFHSTDASLSGIIDTIEAIIIALILALSFRAFVVEAFVIPTGSMAPTLLGAHFDVVCPRCGYAFKRNANLQVQYTGFQGTTDRGVGFVGAHGELNSNRTIPSDEGGAPVICPNCEFPIEPDQFPQHLRTEKMRDQRTSTIHGVTFAWANNGDRILVLKYLYALLDPKRFDVIVFKEPMTARDNYIKRLIGLPGETIEVVSGDVFIAPPGKTAPTDMQIARKPEFLQRDLWQLVYNNDFYPTDEGIARTDGTTWTNPWTSVGSTADKWNIRGPAIQFAADAPGIIEFSNRDPSTYNVLGYNNDIQELNSNKRGLTLFHVGDLRLETVWTPATDAGRSITMTVGHPYNQFRGRWSTDGLTLDRLNPTTHQFENVATVSTNEADVPVTGKSHKVAMENVDHTVRFFIDGKAVLTHETPWTAAQALAQSNIFDSDGRADVPLIRLDVGGVCSLGHLKLFRDLYYTENDPNQTHLRTANANSPLTLGSDEFFALGDNSRESLDGRAWDDVYPALEDLGTRHGIVPRRYLLGKAFFVYWPAGFRATTNDSIPFLSNAPLVPNVGEMRFIR